MDYRALDEISKDGCCKQRLHQLRPRRALAGVVGEIAMFQQLPPNGGKIAKGFISTNRHDTHMPHAAIASPHLFRDGEDTGDEIR